MTHNRPPFPAIDFAAIAAVAAIAWAGAAQAQSPSADDIIAGLKPTAGQLAGPTRGIRPAMIAPGAEADAAAAAQAERAPSHAHIRRVHAESPAAAAAATQAPDAEGPSVKLTIDFRNGSADLTPEASRTLDQLGRALSSQSLATFRFRIEGHTDTVGSPEANKTLSEQRAQAVAAYLEQKFAVDAARLEPVGMGSNNLLVETPDQTPEPRNRRVRVVNLGA